MFCLHKNVLKVSMGVYLPWQRAIELANAHGQLEDIQFLLRILKTRDEIKRERKKNEQLQGRSNHPQMSNGKWHPFLEATLQNILLVLIMVLCLGEINNLNIQWFAEWSILIHGFIHIDDSVYRKEGWNNLLLVREKQIR